MVHQPRSIPVVLAVASAGGHWVQLQRLKTAFDGTELHYATTDSPPTAEIGTARVHLFRDANQETKLRLILCALRLAWIVLRLRPDVVVSTGAAGGALAIRLARLIGARTMFIDSIANVQGLSLSARLCLGHADHVLSQWPAVARASGAGYRGSVLALPTGAGG